MAKWSESKSTVRASHSYESSSRAKWSTKSNSSRGTPTNKEKEKDEEVKKMRKRLERSLWSALDDFNPKATIIKTCDTTQKLMKLVEKYCRFRSHVSTPSHAIKSSTPKPTSASKSSDATKSSSTAKSSSATKPSKDASKPTIAPKSFVFLKSPDATKSSSAAKSPYAAKSSTVTNSFAVAKSKPSSSTPKRDAVKHSDDSIEEVKNELKRLCDSAGFVPLYPTRYKRVPKPIERFAVNLYDEPRARRSTRRHQSNEMDVAVEMPKKKTKVDENKTVYEMQQRQTFTIGWYHVNK